MAQRALAAVVLAAGRGERMRSSRPKALHEIAGKAMLAHVLDTLAELAPERTVCVTGPGMDRVAAAAAPAGTAVQSEALGTAHAVLAAREALAGFDGTVLVLFADTPLIRAETMSALADALAEGAAVAVLGMRCSGANRYGRVVLDAAGKPEAIVEWRDAGPEARALPVCNAGVMAVDGRHLLPLLERVGNDNARGEYYLTDIVALTRADGLDTALVETAEEEALGVNSRAELARAEAAMQRRLRERAFDAGVTMPMPETVWLSHDTRFGRDVTVGPNTVFLPGVTVEEGAEIRAFCHLEGAVVRSGARVGPYARLRPGVDVGPGAGVGNFVEVKNAVLEAGVRANHLAYIGDAHVGAHANIGAGTITCNYDGFRKHRTEIGAGAFIGSNTALVAPVSIGAGAVVGAGSTVSRNVEADALVVERAEQTERKGWAARLRMRRNRQSSGD